LIKRDETLIVNMDKTCQGI